MTRDEVEELIKSCDLKAQKHMKNSLNARKWRNFLEFGTSLVAASASLTMPLLAITGSDALAVAICGNLFVFVNVIIGALKQTFGFITLDYMHGNLSNEFSAMEAELRAFQRRRDVEAGINDELELEKLIARFHGIQARSNIQSIRDCPTCCCFL